MRIIRIVGITGFTSAALLAPLVVFAFCPVCTVAAGVGVGLARWLGVDDTITGVWLGGVLMAVTGWSASWLAAKYPKVPHPELGSTVLWYLLTLVPLYQVGIIGHPQNQLWYWDKLLLGVTVGTVVALLAVYLHAGVRALNGGKSLFPFQRIAFVLGLLGIASGIFYWIVHS